jgi:hypothetical protein
LRYNSEKTKEFFLSKITGNWLSCLAPLPSNGTRLARVTDDLSNTLITELMMFWETKLVILNSLFENVFFASLSANHPPGFAQPDLFLQAIVPLELRPQPQPCAAV